MSNINYNFNKLTPFKFFCLTNFPFIEEDFDALTYYELLCKVVGYLNKVIDTTNAIGIQTEELTNAFNELKSYVDNYFTNLNVQQEINNKLDEMAEDGTLAKIINEDIFNELNQKVDNLINSQFTLPNFFLHCYFDPNGSDENGFNIHLFTSLDNKNVSRIANDLVIDGFNRDAKIYYNEFDKKFYIVTTSGQGGVVAKIIRTDDFINFETKMITIDNISSDYPVWSPNLYFENENIYLNFSYGDSSNNLFDNYLSKCNNLNNLTFNSASKINLLNTQSVSYIDGQINKFNNAYYIILKDNVKNIYQIWKSSSIDGTYTIFNSNVFNCNIPIEGGSISFDGEFYHFNAQAYFPDYQCYITSKTKDLKKFEKFNIINNLYGYNNGNTIYLKNNNAKKIISKLNNFNFSNYDNNLINKINNFNLVEIRNNIDELVILPNTLYSFTGNQDLTINKIVNPFKLQNAQFVFRTSFIKVTINNIENPLDNSVNSINRIWKNSQFQNEKLITLHLYSNFNDDSIYYKDFNDLITLNNTTDFELLAQSESVRGGSISIYFVLKLKQNINGFKENFATMNGSCVPKDLIFINNDNQKTIQVSSDGKISGNFNNNANDVIYCTATYTLI